MFGAILFLVTYVSVCIFIIYDGIVDIKNGYKIEGSLLVVGGITVVLMLFNIIFNIFF